MSASLIICTTGALSVWRAKKLRSELKHTSNYTDAFWQSLFRKPATRMGRGVNDGITPATIYILQNNVTLYSVLGQHAMTNHNFSSKIGALNKYPNFQTKSESALWSRFTTPLISRLVFNGYCTPSVSRLWQAIRHFPRELHLSINQITVLMFTWTKIKSTNVLKAGLKTIVSRYEAITSGFSHQTVKHGNKRNSTIQEQCKGSQYLNIQIDCIRYS